MVRTADGRPVDLCDNLSAAFSRGLEATASARIGAVTTVVSLEKRAERLVGTFQRVSGDEAWCITPMFPQGTTMSLERDIRGAPRFGYNTDSAPLAGLRELLSMQRPGPASY